jgi:hypothetical protein
VEQAGEKLCRFVDPKHVLDSASGPRRPLVIFAFDEAHILADNPPDNEWNLFLELRRILRQIYYLPLFSLFLSTAGRFNQLSTEIRSDASNRVRDSTSCPLNPISEISFDDLAFPALDGTVALHRVVQMHWMSHLGRPLYVRTRYPLKSGLLSNSSRFGSRWDAMVHRSETVLMDFAKQKLLDGPTDLFKDDRPGTLACLSVRFALEFDMDGTARDVACAQVERHMRLCVATTGFERLVTVAGSEPLLAEAAYELMKGTQTNAVRHLAGHSDLHCVDRGRRGELVAALLIVHACDVARGASSFKRRWVSVVDFVKALLPPADYGTIQDSLPTFWRSEAEKMTFEDTFQNYGMWFNHVIKVQDNKMISVDNLWKFVTRGAMIVCTNNQEGVDIVLPLCHTKHMLSPDSVTAVLIQVKNTERFKKDIQETSFDFMSPFDLGIFPEDGPSTAVTPKPVIRLVFALTSPEAGVVFRERAGHRSHPDTFTAFDIWLAGLSTDTFAQIGGDLDAYRTLLERSLRPHDAFELMDDRVVGEKAKKLRVSRRRRMAPLTFTGPDHGAIHRQERTGVVS